MVSNWLYPLSSKSGYLFELSTGPTESTGEVDLVRLIGDQPDEEMVWVVSNNARNMRPGDLLWSYYGQADRDRGIVACGTVTGVELPKESGAKGQIRFTWNMPITRRLLADPLPAAKVRKFIKWPAFAVLAMPDGLVRLVGTPKKRPPATQGTRPSQPSIIVYTPPRKDITVWRRHDALLVPVQARLGLAGWKDVDFDIRPKRADLAMSHGSDIVLIEAKTIGDKSSIDVRDAFSQLAEYKWRYLRTHPKARITPWALFERKPKDDEVAFIEDHGILVSWAVPARRQFEYGPLTSQHRVVRSLRPR